MRIKLVTVNRIFESSHKLIHVIQFLIVLNVVTDKNLTAFAYKLLNITLFSEKIGVYNLILEKFSEKLGVCSCVFIVVC